MIAIIDYGMGNLRSVQKGFERVGHAAEIVDDPRKIAAAKKIVLPGVGAFEDCIGELKRRDFVGPIRDVIAAGKPFLGICLGMQVLFDVSYEGGEFAGLGIIPGKVVRFEIPPQYKVPHMGWNQATIVRRSPLLTGIEDRSYFYFVHSYHCVPENENVIAMTSDYPDPFTAAIWKENVFAAQFHPEKSQASGLKILANFAAT